MYHFMNHVTCHKYATCHTSPANCSVKGDLVRAFYVHLSAAYDLWFVVCGLWFVVCGLWFCGLRFVVCGLRFVVCGLWFAVCSFCVCLMLHLVRTPLVCVGYIPNCDLAILSASESKHALRIHHKIKNGSVGNEASLG